MDSGSHVSLRRIFPTAVYVSVFLGIILYGTYVFAESGGMTGVTRKNGNGCTCHNASPSASVIVTIDGPAQLTPGQVGNYTVTIQGGPAVRAGTDIAASAGSLNPGSSALQKVGDELTHVSPRPFSSGSVVFPFTYTAPTTPGTYILYANGNSVNFNGSNTGDQWNFAPDKSVTVKAATSVGNTSVAPAEFSLAQNYPNPFNPSTTISYSVARSAQIQLGVYDLEGKLVQMLVDGPRSAGSYRMAFNAAGLASGTYVATLRVDGAVVRSNRMALVK